MSWIRSSVEDSRRGIDRRRPEIESRAQFYRDEQERVQKKTFTNWINTYLVQYQPPCKISDLFAEIKDGIKLLQLLEVLSGQKLPQESRKPMQRVHSLSNVRTALSFLEGKEIKLVNINPADIVDGKPSIVLGLIWTIILYFQLDQPFTEISNISRPIEEQEDTIMKTLEGTELAERGEKFKGSAKKALLAWAQNNLGDKYEIDIKDFGNSWRDGSAFNAMVHNIDPSLVDMTAVRGRTNRENLEAAFAAAENGLNIPRLIDPEDVDVDKPDEKSIMTYVAQFLKAYPEGSKKKPKLLEQMEAARLDAVREHHQLCQQQHCQHHHSTTWQQPFSDEGFASSSSGCCGGHHCCCEQPQQNPHRHHQEAPATGAESLLYRAPSAYDLTCSHLDYCCSDCADSQTEVFATFGTVRAASRASSRLSPDCCPHLRPVSEGEEECHGTSSSSHVSLTSTSTASGTSSKSSCTSVSSIRVASSRESLSQLDAVLYEVGCFATRPWKVHGLILTFSDLLTFATWSNLNLKTF